jgi:hypothetical protein
MTISTHIGSTFKIGWRVMQGWYGHGTIVHLYVGRRTVRIKLEGKA